MADRFSRQVKQLDSPFTDGFSVTTSNTTVFAQPTRALYIGEAGNLHLEMTTSDGVSNTELTFVGLPAGTMLNVRAHKVFSNTTANSIIGLY